MMTSFLASDLRHSLNPSILLSELDFPPYEWQIDVLSPLRTRVLLVAARQSGKSSVESGDAYHSFKYTPGSLNIIIAPSEQQSKETMKKVDDFLALDPDVDLDNNASFEKKSVNGARIIALPGTERSVRGYSKPRRVILDEASRIEDATFKACRPYLVGNPEAKMVAVTTPFGKRGWFYEAWEHNPYWHKVLVKPAYKLSSDNQKVVPDIPEDEFRAMWEKKGVSAYYSPRHTHEFLTEELETIGWWWWRQEYGCEFLDTGHGVFDMQAVRDAYDETEEWFSDDEMGDDSEVLQF